MSFDDVSKEDLKELLVLMEKPPAQSKEKVKSRKHSKKHKKYRSKSPSSKKKKKKKHAKKSKKRKISKNFASSSSDSDSLSDGEKRKKRRRRNDSESSTPTTSESDIEVIDDPNYLRPVTVPEFRRKTPPEQRKVFDSERWKSRMINNHIRRDVAPFQPKEGPPKGIDLNFSQEDRDNRTVKIMQIRETTTPEELEEFFSSVGTVRDVRLIIDYVTQKSQKLAYVEFWESEAVTLSIGLNGQKLNDCPIQIMPTSVARNRSWNHTVGAPTGWNDAEDITAEMKLYIGALHNSIKDHELKGIFEPYGEVLQIKIERDEKNRSLGHGFVIFKRSDDGRRAMEQLNGFQLGGRPLVVGKFEDDRPKMAAPANVPDFKVPTKDALPQKAVLMAGKRRTDALMKNLDEETKTDSKLVSLEMGSREGINLGLSGRQALMAKLAEGAGLSLLSQTQQLLSQQQHTAMQAHTPSIATQCLMLSNMFDINEERTNPRDWAEDIRDDVIEECQKHGGALHVYVDKDSTQGNVYVKCTTVPAAVNIVNALHGRWFAGKIIMANYIPLPNYHKLFDDARYVSVPLRPSYETKQYEKAESASKAY